MPFADLREWLEKVDRIGEIRTFEDVDPELEIGALTELSAEAKGPALLFDKIKGFPPGFRVVSNLFRGNKRLLATLEMPIDLNRRQALRRWMEVISNFKPVPPVEVKSGPVLQHTMTGGEVDISVFPAPRWHELDGGNYIGTGDLVIVRDPDTGWINLGSYRIMNHDRNTGGIFIQTMRHGYAIAKKYWKKGQACPVAVSLGNDPMLLLAAGDTVARTAEKICEYDFAGYVRGQPVEVVAGKLTGFPIPATAEVVLEGDIPSPEEELRPEGPFGEYLGYYAHGRLPELVLRVKGVSYRDNPILIGKPPLKPTFGGRTSLPLSLANLWNRLERKGITGIQDMRTISGASALVIALHQEKEGHVESLIQALGELQNIHRLTVIVDDDINLDDPRDVIWAIGTRSEIKTGTHFFIGVSGDQLDPMMPPDVREEKGIFEFTRSVINACRPYRRLHDFPPVCVFGDAWRKKINDKWGTGLFSPGGS
ncbi:MAG: UbiD family decarboxylase [Deltaproteobacteria bacterium]|nr:UbiD family decarboxylase [Deltaproteobacteria bacterium]